MFICDSCGKSTKPRQSCNKVVRETRPRVYEHIILKGSGEQKFEKKFTSRGVEIAKEEKLCRECMSAEVDKELLSKGREVTKDFDQSQGYAVTPRIRK